MNRNIQKILDTTKVPLAYQLNCVEMDKIFEISKGESGGEHPLGFAWWCMYYGFKIGFNAGSRYGKKQRKKA